MAGDYTFRESDPPGRVELRLDGKVIFSHPEYRGTAGHALKVLKMPDWQVMDMYSDYREDAEERGLM
jgi:hypothetical protein